MRYTITYLNPDNNNIETTTVSDILSASLALEKFKRKGYEVTSVEVDT